MGVGARAAAGWAVAGWAVAAAGWAEAVREGAGWAGAGRAGVGWGEGEDWAGAARAEADCATYIADLISVGRWQCTHSGRHAIGKRTAFSG